MSLDNVNNAGEKIFKLKNSVKVGGESIDDKECILEINLLNSSEYKEIKDPDEEEREELEERKKEIGEQKLR